MRLRKFTLLKKASRADQLTRRVSTDLIESIKKLDSKQIRNLFRGFVPLDFISLLQKHNGEAFEQALRQTITQQLSTDQHKKWIEEAGLSQEDAVGETYISMLNDDPKRRGILSEILLDGSYSDAFQYARKDDPKTRLDLRQSLRPLSSENGMVVPFCPICKSLNIDHPLWDISTDQGTVEFKQGQDQQGRCTEVEYVGDSLEQAEDQLTNEQREAIESGKRELQFEGGKAFLRCTFTNQMPKFQSFLHSRARQAVKEILDPQRRQMGRTIPPAKYKRRAELEEKERQNTLDLSEKTELIQLREYFNKRQVNYVHNPTSLDVNVGDEGRSLHETVVVDSDQDDESIEDARFELQRKLDEKQFEVLSIVSSKVPLGSLLNSMTDLYGLSNKDPKRVDLQNQIQTNVIKAAQKYYAADQTNNNRCNTCGTELDDTANSCPYAAQMRSSIFSAYDQASDLAELNQSLEKLDSQALEHYKASNLGSILNKGFSGVEVDEEDLLDGLDLSGFDSLDEEIDSSVLEKISTDDLKSLIEKELSSKNQQSFYGLDITGNQVEEQDVEKVNQLAKYLYKILNDVFSQELEDELATFLIGYGAS